MSDWMTRDVSHVTMESFFQSIGTLRQTNLTEEVKKITVPTMGMYGKRDIIVRPKQREVLKASVPHAQIVYYTDAGHFPMLDTPEKFLQDLSDFLRS
jgi:pimeloyl-ACP methyl ester carboxylesterase